MSNPVNRAIHDEQIAKWTAWEAEHAKCVAHRERARLETELLFALGLRKLKPWQFGISSFPGIVAGLDAALLAG